jgi:RNA polymerase sigma-70 factor (ECF subfamily)
VPSLADAEDALQEAFIHFWQSRERVRDPLTYLYSCVRNAALDLRRTDQRRERRELFVSRSEHETWFDTRDAEDDRRKAIEGAVGQLPIDQREALIMRIWGGATFLQIGETLGVSAKTAAARYSRALETLSRSLSEDLV